VKRIKNNEKRLALRWDAADILSGFSFLFVICLLLVWIFFCLLAKTIFPFSLKSTGGDVESILMDKKLNAGAAGPTGYSTFSTHWLFNCRVLKKMKKFP